ncbi:MAG: EAL domain-containing protein [gamma proteobacterium symbiont of Taylorina sp.]|nr:EAL domain-containing protein [gamma proteobacterium symbiont of Taylorina sp.]
MKDKLTNNHSNLTSTGGLVTFILIIVSCLLLLTWLFLKTAFVTSDEHINYLHLLDKHQETEAKLDAELLASKIDLTENYDALNFFIREIDSISQKILQTPEYLLNEEQIQLIKLAKQLQLTVQNKVDGIDLFKRNNALLHNSLAYFQQLSDSYSLSIETGSITSNSTANNEMIRLLSPYIRNIMFFVQSPDQTLYRTIQTAEETIELEIAAEGLTSIENLLLHGRIIKKFVPILDKQIRQILAYPTALLHQQYKQLYLNDYHAAQNRADKYRIALYAVGILLTFYLAITFIHLIRTQQSLQTAHQEVSQRYQAQLRIERLLRFHDAAFNSAHEGITITDADGTILDVNPSFSRITGYSREEAIGHNPRVLKSGRHDAEFYHAMWKNIYNKGNWRGEIWNRNKYGDIYPELLSITAIKDLQGKVTNYVAVFTDISQLKDQEKQLQKMAFYDALTGLPNRVLLTERMHQLMLQTQRNKNLLAVCFLDLDGFKAVNDLLGHKAGDSLLIEMADRLKQSLRGEDTIARIGGDEFVILLTGSPEISLYEQTIQRLLITISHPVQIDSESISVSGSIGIAFYPIDQNDADTLLRHADQAMYQAKQIGKNCYHLFDPKTDTQVRQKNETISRIEKALIHNEFLLYYQPKVNIRKGQIYGMEALIRWQDPDRGMIPPNEFLPLVENDDLIIRIGDWVIETALKQIQQWQSEGIEVSVSINVASRQFQETEFFNKLKQALSKYSGIKPGQLEIEILETAALDDIIHVSRIMEQCQEIGISFALDDFGTGYSSLTYLKRLPAETLKIDQSFIKDMLQDPGELAIVHGVLGLATAFQRNVVAEGVESVEHGITLIQLGCDILQGYAIAKPMPAAEVLNWISLWKPAAMMQEINHLHWNDMDYSVLSAMVEHRFWIHSLVYAVESALTLPHQNIQDFCQCRFGKWYYGLGKQLYGHHSIFQQIELPHQRVHAICGQIEDDYNSGNQPHSKELLPELLQQHLEVVQLINKLLIIIASKD